MKTAIISDTHLTHRFEPKKYVFLKKLLESVDEVIINGDFWDSMSTSFDSFIKSPWQQLFPLLIAKKTVYVYGNHDKKEMMDERVSLFSVLQTDQHTTQTNPKKLVIYHGHQHTFSLEGYITNKTARKITNTAHSIVEKLALKIFGTAFFQKTVYKSYSNSILKHAQANLKDDEVLVCGHSHSVFFMPNKKYINSGFIRHGLAQYLIIENKKIRAVEEWY